jgi:hypothetical protein
MAFLTKGAATPQANPYLQARNGARWFYWIAGLSVLNSAVALAGSQFMMLFGLTSTLLGTYLGIYLGGAGPVVGMVIAVLVALGFAGLGFLAERGAVWAFMTGLILYTADGLLTLFYKDWFAAAAHLFAIVIIFIGMQAMARLKKAGATPLPGARLPGMAAPAVVTVPIVEPASVQAPGDAAPMPPQPGSDTAPGFAEATAPPPLD